MKYLRVVIAVVVAAICVLLAMPELLTSEIAETGAAVDTEATPVPVPTPNYDEIAPVVTAVPESEATAAPRATATPAPAQEEGGPRYVLDLWLDASPNMAGISPLDGSYRRGTSQYGQWLGGYFYNASSNGNSKKLDQQGWMTSLLNMLYGKEAAGLGSVRILRLAAESMIAPDQLTALQEQYPDVDLSALIRDTLTYHVIRNNSENHLSFFQSLLRTSGDMIPGGGSPYDLKECFFSPNKHRINNRTLLTSEWDWDRETTDTALLEMMSLLVNNAIQGHNARIQEGRSSNSPEEDDYLYYALGAMDPSHLNVVVLDTLGLPELDQHIGLYSQRIQDMVAMNGGDLTVGYIACQMDYAGKISTIGGRTLENGFVWGFENFYKLNKNNGSQLRYGFVQPMPRPILLLVVGPDAQVTNYTDVLCRHMDREMQDGGLLAGVRGEPAGRGTDACDPFDSFKFNGESFTSPVFGFQYKCTTMTYMDVVSEQSELMDVLSRRLRESAESLVFVSDEEELETMPYEYDTTVGNSESSETVPVITANMGSDVRISLDLALDGSDTFTVAEEQYDSSVTVVSALETQSFTLEEIDALSRTGGLDLSAGSEILADQAYIALDNRIYKYHLTDGSGFALKATQPVIADGKLMLTLSADGVPTPGYYWITLQMRSKALAELDNQSWNTIDTWMQADTRATDYDPENGPAVLDSQNFSWDFTPSNYELNSYASTDSRLENMSNALVEGDQKRNFLHHAWGSALTQNSNVFPADIPPVFRLFQFNRIATGIRDGLLDRSGSIGSAPFLTRHFIICVPEPTTAGEQ